jgi:lysophospholipase L1-like esterase
MNTFKTVLFVIAATLLLLLGLELAARVYISYAYGISDAGITERTQYLTYQPFIMWGKNLDRLAEEYEANKSKNDYFKILLIGGSTADAFDSETLAVAFEKVLQRKIILINAASGGFNIRQEAISLVLISERIQPDLILVLDGANDVMHALRPGVKPGTTYVDSTYRLILEKPYLAPLIYVLQHSQLYNGLMRLTARRNFLDSSSQVNMPAVLKIYFETRKFMANYARGAPTPIVFMLQPHVGFSSSQNDLSAKKLFAYREAAVVHWLNEISNQTDDSICFVNSNKFIMSRDANLNFSDDVHFRDLVGYRFLADLFVDQYKACYGQKL